MVFKFLWQKILKSCFNNIVFAVIASLEEKLKISYKWKFSESKIKRFNLNIEYQILVKHNFSDS